MKCSSWKVPTRLRDLLGAGPSEQAIDKLAAEIKHIHRKAYMKGFYDCRNGDHDFMDVLEDEFYDY
jgi:hypothetical protein